MQTPATPQPATGLHAALAYRRRTPGTRRRCKSRRPAWSVPLDEPLLEPELLRSSSPSRSCSTNPSCSQARRGCCSNPSCCPLEPEPLPLETRAASGPLLEPELPVVASSLASSVVVVLAGVVGGRVPVRVVTRVAGAPVVTRVAGAPVVGAGVVRRHGHRASAAAAARRARVLVRSSDRGVGRPAAAGASAAEADGQDERRAGAEKRESGCVAHVGQYHTAEIWPAASAANLCSRRSPAAVPWPPSPGGTAASALTLSTVSLVSERKHPGAPLSRAHVLRLRPGEHRRASPEELPHAGGRHRHLHPVAGARQWPGVRERRHPLHGARLQHRRARRRHRGARARMASRRRRAAVVRHRRVRRALPSPDAARTAAGTLGRSRDDRPGRDDRAGGSSVTTGKCGRRCAPPGSDSAPGGSWRAGASSSW